ncbi:MAG: ABC transporter permease subunit [Candidatus Dormibacteraeota bacterium]|nr:ABC transporter permease subunit [Candidatus Dormibacteraeota bacterium]
MLRIALRQQRIGMFGISFLSAVACVVQAAAFTSAVGTTEAARQAFASQTEILGQQLTYLLPAPVGVDTIGGYLQWREYGGFPILILIWALLSASGAVRGDEEKGLVDVWLSEGVSRFRYVMVRFLGFAIGATFLGAAMGGATYLGALAAGFSLDPLSVFEASLALVLLTVACYALALVLSQLVATRNAAAGIAGGVLLVMFFVNSFGRTIESLRSIARVISPFYYYDRSDPLVVGGTFDVTANAGLLVAAGILAVVAAWLMQLRDVGSPLIRFRPRGRPPVHQPDHNPLLRLPVLESLYEQRVGLAAWTLGAALGAAYFASLGHQIVDLLTSSSGGFRAYLALVHGDPYVVLTGFFWFGFFQLMLAVYAITQVSRWAGEDNEGRLEMKLSAPVPRWRVVVERAVTLLASLTIMIGVSTVAFYLEGRAAGIYMPSGALFLASVILIPFATTFAAVGATLASRVPRATVAVLSAIAAISYLANDLGPLFHWPDWALKLSIFSLYGNPISGDVKWDGLWEMLAICVLGFGLAIILMQRREVGR